MHVSFHVLRLVAAVSSAWHNAVSDGVLTFGEAVAIFDGVVSDLGLDDVVLWKQGG